MNNEIKKSLLNFFSGVLITVVGGYGLWYLTQSETVCSMSTLEHGINYPGNRLEHLSDIDAASSCSLKCEDEKSCKAWGWRDNQCWLKTERGSAKPNESVVSGYKVCK